MRAATSPPGTAPDADEGSLRRRAIAILCAALILVPVAPSPESGLGSFARAWARPPKKPAPPADVGPVIQRAETLLDKLEYERAREVLEATVRDPQYKKARPFARARLWALLGRARAELGDSVGADEAFLRAVSLDRRVKLPRTTSPKILDALERARLNAPPPGEGKEQAEEAPEEREEPKAPPAPRSTAPKPREQKRSPKTPPASKPGEPATPPPGEGKPPASKPARAPHEGKPPASKPAETPREGKPPASKPAETPREAKPRAPLQPKPEAPAETGPDTAPPPAKPTPPPKPAGPTIRHHVEGKMGPGKTVTLVIETEHLPKDTRLDLQVRRGQSGAFHSEPLTKSGTVSTHKFKMDRPRVELFVRATKGKKLVAKLGSQEDPIVISVLPPPPSIADAWSVPDVRPALIKSSTRTATGTAARTPRIAASRTPPPPLPTPPTSTSTSTAGTKRLIVTHVDTRPEKEDNTLLYAGLAAGGAVLIGGIILFFVLKGGSTKKECDIKEGFGCAQIQVLPQPLIAF